MLCNFSKAGTLFELVGEKGSGKTSLIHTICATNTINNKKSIYIDGSGSFRPEFIREYLDRSANYSKEEIIQHLKNISYVRVYEPESITGIFRKIRLLNVDCIVIDDLLYLYLHHHRAKIRFEVRKFIREMALIALIKKINIIFTNTIVRTKRDQDLEAISYELFYNDVVRYIHVKALLQNNINNIIDCSFIYPESLESIKLKISVDRADTL